MIRRVREWSDVPIIVLSVRDGQRDKVDAFEAGADDYVTKPFGMRSSSPGCAPFAGGPKGTAALRSSGSTISRSTSADNW